MWISYSESEVKKFHPICEEALNEALKKLNMHNKYEVIHHKLTGTLEMDFVIQNTQTKKYLCVIEVKRTPNDIHSTRYQYQAMSYVQMNAQQNEKPFYILTNLEYAFLFRYDSSKPQVFQQILNPGLIFIENFSNSNKNEFLEKLTDFFKKILKDFFENNFEYLTTLDDFVKHMEMVKEDWKKWKTDLAFFCYEYIRGAFNFINRKDLKDIRLFNNNIKKICKEGAKVNFKNIFQYSEEEFDLTTNIQNNDLIEIYNFGNKNISGDYLANVLHQIVSAGHEHEGEVPTDLELGNILSVLAKKYVNNLEENEVLCDPAVGSGNLISSALNIFSLSPKQILVNDWNKKLLELLSLRLGLSYAEIISPSNTVQIFNNNIADLDKDFFEKVKIILMNPPFVAGINCIERKRILYQKIYELSEKEAITKVGQAPFESVFLELICNFVKEGTLIACIFPKTHLLARGIEAKHTRKIIVEKLGIHLIFTYPGEEIFSEVTKDTCILLGKVGKPSDEITVISSYEKIPNLDINSFMNSLDNTLTEEFEALMPGIEGRKISLTNLKDNLVDGWRFLNNEMIEAYIFVEEHFEYSDKIIKLSENTSTQQVKRGTAGNNGGSDLIFFDSRNELYSQFEDKNINFKVGMRNAKLSSFIVNQGDSKFLDITSIDADLLDQILRAYTMLNRRSGNQQRREKTREELIEILNRESQLKFNANSVLLPRGIRKHGRVYLTKNSTYVSTNFIVYTMNNYDKALLFASWVSTIFYQLICEISSKDQEGMRKMEKADFNETFIPDFDKISNGVLTKIIQIENEIVFLKLNEPEIRNIDIIWAEELFGENGQEILEKAKELLEFLVNRRNPN